LKVINNTIKVAKLKKKKNTHEKEKRKNTRFLI